VRYALEGSVQRGEQSDAGQRAVIDAETWKPSLGRTF